MSSTVHAIHGLGWAETDKSQENIKENIDSKRWSQRKLDISYISYARMRQSEENKTIYYLLRFTRRPIVISFSPHSAAFVSHVIFPLIIDHREPIRNGFGRCECINFNEITLCADWSVLFWEKEKKNALMNVKIFFNLIQSSLQLAICYMSHCHTFTYRH